jgi:hypothetical protein
MAPQITKGGVPSYEIIEEKIKGMDGAVIIFRIFYIPENFTYRFQLLRNNRICMVEIPGRLLDSLRSGDPAAEDELTELLNAHLQNSDCWVKS